MTKNRWDRFDIEWYINCNYRSIHDEDRDILKVLVPYYKYNISSSSSVLDIGTGPNLYPLFAVYPYASRVTCLERSQKNMRYIDRQIKKLDDHWSSFLEYLSSLDEKYQSNVENFASKVTTLHGSILRRVPPIYDVVSMFFCAESISSSERVFRLACKNFAHAARQEGHLVAAFMENSLQYAIGPTLYPSYPVNRTILMNVFSLYCNNLNILHIQKSEHPLREGYTGMLLLTGVRK